MSVYPLTVKSRVAEPLTQSYAIVTRLDGASIEVRTEDGESLWAQRAASCLVPPSDGDRVLVCTGRGEAWVLAVLTTAAQGPTRLETEGDLEIVSRTGAVRMRATEEVQLAGGSQVSIVSPRVRVSAEEAHVAVRLLGVVGEALKAELSRVKVVAGVFDGVFERLSHKAKRVFRFVEEVEVVRAKEIDQLVGGMMRLHARDAAITAEQLVKVDAAQIQLG